MRSAHHVRIAVLNLVLKGSVLAAAVSLCILVIPRTEDDGADSAPNAASIVEPSLVGDTAQLRMSIAEGRWWSRYSMQDEAGRERISVTYDRNDAVNTLLGDDFPVRAVSRATPEGLYKLDVVHKGMHYNLEIKPDGSSDYSVFGASAEGCGHLRLSPDGQPIPEPVNID